MKKQTGIYIIRRVGTTDSYVGQSVDIAQRWACHRRDLKQGRHKSPFMQAVYGKHGIEAFSFEVLEAGFDPAAKAEITSAEQKWIDRLLPTFNSQPSAQSSAGYKHSAATREKHSRLMMGNTINVGRQSWMKGRRHTPESRAKVSAAKKGQPGPNRGIPRSEDVKRKISLKKSGVPWSPARRAALNSRTKEAFPCHP